MKSGSILKTSLGAILFLIVSFGIAWIWQNPAKFFSYTSKNQPYVRMPDDNPPEPTFKNYFKSPISQVIGLQGGGVAWLGSEYWIRFESAAPVVLREEDQYQKLEEVPNQAVLYFLGKFPKDKGALQNRADLICFFNPGKRKSPSSNGTWFLYNKKSEVYFFRYWFIT